MWPMRVYFEFRRTEVVILKSREPVVLRVGLDEAGVGLRPPGRSTRQVLTHGDLGDRLGRDHLAVAGDRNLELADQVIRRHPRATIALVPGRCQHVRCGDPLLVIAHLA